MKIKKGESSSAFLEFEKALDLLKHLLANFVSFLKAIFLFTGKKDVNYGKRSWR